MLRPTYTQRVSRYVTSAHEDMKRVTNMLRPTYTLQLSRHVTSAHRTSKRVTCCVETKYLMPSFKEWPTHTQQIC